MNRYFKLILSSIFAGIVMAFAGFELVAMNSHGSGASIAGAFLQGFGLILVLYFNLSLYNCKLCDIFHSNKKWQFLLDLLIILIVNIATIIGMAYLSRIMTNNNEGFIESANALVDTRLVRVLESEGKEWYVALLSGLGCGMICYFAGYIYKKDKYPLVRIMAVFIGVGLYVICGLENLMTNTFYIAFSQNWCEGTAVNLVMVFLGNTLGIYLTHIPIKLFLKTNKK